MTRTTHDEFVQENRRTFQTAIAEKFNTGTVSINVNIARLIDKKKCARLKYVAVFTVTAWALTLPTEANMLNVLGLFKKYPDWNCSGFHWVGCVCNQS